MVLTSEGIDQIAGLSPPYLGYMQIASNCQNTNRYRGASASSGTVSVLDFAAAITKTNLIRTANLNRLDNIFRLLFVWAISERKISGWQMKVYSSQAEEN
jgi:hypothetical protein